jgi:UDP-N-acetylglucosamine diphosphorylase / glucose-1-phosphate thymidylyltransferase / UDP-N-acetylgalactosamine diphosphorylase / glucosamine-1-phosphate N-acetyltransferase / galactosamine-1-phosphate N-acetyltransferase
MRDSPMVKKAVVLAAGEGKRLRPFTETMPKVMLPVANKPILEYVFDAIKDAGITDVFCVVGYKKEVIQEHFKDYTKLNITYIVQDKQLGTAHALLQAKNQIKEPFIVLAGDNIIDSQSIVRLIQNPAEYAILIKKHPHPSKYGVIFFKDNKISQIVEKPKEDIGEFISTGIYKLPKSFFTDLDRCANQGIYALSAVIQNLIDNHKKISTTLADLWMDIVYPWDLIMANEVMSQHTTANTSGTIEKNVTLKGPISIGKDTIIYSGCYIVGPVIIGDSCEIGPNACIFPSTTIGNNSAIHPFTEVRNSVIMEDTHIGSNSLISHSVIGKGCSTGPGFSTLAQKATIEIEEKYKRLSSPIGAMIGEDCIIGSHVTVYPGTIIGRKCTIGSLTKIQNSIPSETNVM